MYYFIVNEHGASGLASHKWNVVQKVLENKNVQYKIFIPQYTGHATEIAKEISETDDTDIRLVIVGGDGTINEVLNGITDFSRIKLGLIPTGSGNDFSRGLKIPRHHPKKVINNILNSATNKTIDLGKTKITKNGKKKSRIFGISSGFGFDAIVGTGINDAKMKTFFNKLHIGKISYIFLTIKTLFSMKTQDLDVTFDDEEKIHFEKLIFISAMNFKAEGGGVKMTPSAMGDDGFLSVCVAHDIPKWLTFFIFPLLIFGLHTKLHPFFLIKNCKKLKISSSTKNIIHTDGEFFGNIQEAQFECLEKRLKVIG